MFIVFLRFSDNRENAGSLMDGHRAWIKQGFDEDVFLLAGSLDPDRGGAILAHNTTASTLSRPLRASFTARAPPREHPRSTTGPSTTSISACSIITIRLRVQVLAPATPLSGSVSCSAPTGLAAEITACG